MDYCFVKQSLTIPQWKVLSKGYYNNWCHDIIFLREKETSKPENPAAMLIPGLKKSNEQVEEPMNDITHSHFREGKNPYSSITQNQTITCIIDY